MPVLETLFGLAEDALDAIGGDAPVQRLDRRPSPRVRAARERVSSRASRASQGSCADADRPVRTEFRLVEAVDAEDGRASFVLHNDAGDRAECNSYELAERIRRALG